MRTTLCLFAATLTACATTPPAPAPARAAAPTPTATEPDEPIPTLQLPDDVRPTRYALELTIDPDQPEFSGVARIEVTLARARKVLWLHGLDLKVSEATVLVGAERRPAKWEQVNDDGVVRLSVEQAVPAGPATLEVRYARPYDPRLVGLYLAPEAGHAYAFTQFEDIFARRAFPSFDQPSFKTPFDVTLVVPTSAVAVANTAPVDEAVLPDGHRRVRFAPTRPLPTYLLAWAVGPFDVVVAPTLPPSPLRSAPVPMRGIAPKGRGAELARELDVAAQLLLRQEAYFQLPFAYPKLDSVAVPDYAYGAMENAGEIHYREDLLLFKEGTGTTEQQLDSADVIAHEQAHQWFGDLVTMPWWTDAWLNESFATWFATRTVSEWKPEWRAEVRLQRRAEGAMHNDALASARAIRQPVTSVKAIFNQFDSLTYQKGGAVLAMFERWLGPEKFRAGISRYLADHADGSGSTDDLLRALSTASGRDVTGPFKSFLDQAGVPEVKVSVSCGEQATVSFEQRRYLPLGATRTPAHDAQRWGVPVCLRYAVGRAAPTEQCVLVSEPSQRLTLPGCPSWLMPNAEGAGYYRWSLTGPALAQLLRSTSALSVRERLSVVNALEAAARAGTLPIAEVLAAVEPLAQDLDPDVAAESVGLLRTARDRLVSPADRPKVDARLRALYLPVLRRVGAAPAKGELAAVGNLRTEVLDLLAHLDEPSVVKDLTQKARAYLGVRDGVMHPEALSPDLARSALVAAVEHGDQASFDAIEQRLKTVDDASVRDALVWAFSSARAPALAQRALEAARAGAVRKQETAMVFFAQSLDERTREGAWQYLRANFDQVLSRMPPPVAGYLPMLAQGFCDEGHEAEVRAFFEPKRATVPGLELKLQQALETNRVCGAFVAAQRSSATEYFRAASPPPVRAPPAR